MDQFNDYLVFGGYPEVALEKNINERILLLKELKNSFLKKDIDEAGISYQDKFYMLLTLLAGQTGNLVNRNELANTIGVDNKTIDNYLHVLQNSFHIELVKPFYSNIRKELTKMPKIYFKDTGMRNSALNRFFDFKNREDQGQLLENYFYNRLTNIYDKDNIRFWRTTDKKEIDFIVTTSFKEGFFNWPISIPNPGNSVGLHWGNDTSILPIFSVCSANVLSPDTLTGINVSGVSLLCSAKVLFPFCTFCTSN
jgi:uncharacterized protein